MTDTGDNPYASRDHEAGDAPLSEADVLAAASMFNMVGSQLTGVDQANVGEKGEQAQRLDPSSITNLQTTVSLPTPSSPSPSNFPSHPGPVTSTPTIPAAAIHSPPLAAPSPPQREYTSLPEDQLKKIVRLLVQKMNTLQLAMDKITGTLQSIFEKVPDNPKQVAITLDFPSTTDADTVNEDTLDDLDRSILDEVAD